MHPSPPPVNLPGQRITVLVNWQGGGFTRSIYSPDFEASLMYERALCGHTKHPGPIVYSHHHIYIVYRYTKHPGPIVYSHHPLVVRGFETEGVEASNFWCGANRRRCQPVEPPGIGVVHSRAPPSPRPLRTGFKAEASHTFPVRFYL